MVGSTGMYWVVVGCTRWYWAVLGCVGLYLAYWVVLLGSNWLY